MLSEGWLCDIGFSVLVVVRDYREKVWEGGVFLSFYIEECR